MISEAVNRGKLDTRIDISQYDGDFSLITEGINETLEKTVTIFDDIGTKLTLLSSGKFLEEEEEEEEEEVLYVGDYEIFKQTQRKITRILSQLIKDSDMMNEAASLGTLDVRIDTTAYKGDFALITNGINETMEETVLRLRNIGNILNKLSAGNFMVEEEEEEVKWYGDYAILKKSTDELHGYISSLSTDLDQFNKAVENDNFDFVIDSAKYKGYFALITKGINQNRELTKKDLWLKDGIAQLNKSILSKNNLYEQMDVAITTICEYLDASMGAFYLYDENTRLLTLEANYAFVSKDGLCDVYSLDRNNKYEFGMIGQVAKSNTPHHGALSSQLIDINGKRIKPQDVYIYPIIYREKLLGVLNISSLEEFSDIQIQFLEDSNLVIAATLYASIQANSTINLLGTTKEQAQELQAQKDNLEKQKTKLEEFSTSLETKNLEVEQKAFELEESNKYKSEFLANMSHELKTPLNSIIVLSNLLKGDDSLNLTEERAGQLRTINTSGEELLELINGILDLSKIEAKMTSIHVEEFNLKDELTDMYYGFKPVLGEYNLEMKIDLDDKISRIKTDKIKLKQILKNFISNAMKFTPAGKSVTINTKMLDDSTLPICISVIDEGMGIAKDKQDMIFEAFKQVDGSTSREFGGTGLGLSISRELAHLLGGKITLESEIDQGSVFSLLLPLEIDLSGFDESQIDIVEVPKFNEDLFNKVYEKKVLLLYDNIDDWIELVRSCEAINVSVLTAANDMELKHCFEDETLKDYIYVDGLNKSLDEVMKLIKEA
jgi:signal transduction histidine kinase